MPRAPARSAAPSQPIITWRSSVSLHSAGRRRQPPRIPRLGGMLPRLQGAGRHRGRPRGRGERPWTRGRAGRRRAGRLRIAPRVFRGGLPCTRGATRIGAIVRLVAHHVEAQPLVFPRISWRKAQRPVPRVMWREAQPRPNTPRPSRSRPPMTGKWVILVTSAPLGLSSTTRSTALFHTWRIGSR